MASLQYICTALRSPIRLVRIGLHALIVTLALSGCWAWQTNLRFDTIERSAVGYGNRRYRTSGPQLIIVCDVSQLAALDGAVFYPTWAQLQKVDFQQYIVIAVFQGALGVVFYPRSGIEIRSITLRGKTVTVHATVYKHTPGTEVMPEQTAPYHIVQVRRGRWTQDQVEYLLDLDGEMINPKTPPQPTPTQVVTYPPSRRTVPSRTPSKAPTKPTSGIIPGSLVAGAPVPIRHRESSAKRSGLFIIDMSNLGCGLGLAFRPEEGLKTP
jgi:hypothetical protein